MSRSRRSLRFIALVASLCAVSFVAGYFTGRPAEDPENRDKRKGAVAAATALSGPAKNSSETARTRPTESQNTTGPVLSAPEMTLAVTRACAMGHDVRIEEEFLNLIPKMTAENAAALVEELTRAANRPYGRPSKSVWSAVWRQWGRVDGAAAMKYLFADAPNKKDADVVQVMRGWLTANPAAAEAWLKTPLQPPGFWNAAWAVWQAGAGNPSLDTATARVLQTGTTPELREAGFKHLTDRALLEGGSAGLTAWLNTVPASLQTEASRHVAWRLVRSDPQAAVDWITANKNQPWRDDRHSTLLIEQLINDDPTATAAWAASLYPSPPNTPQDQNPVYQAARQWSQRNPGSARAWLEENKTAPWAETARAGYTSAVGPEHDDPLTTPQ